MAEEKKRLHLKDLIAPGKEVTIRIYDPKTKEEGEATVFMHKPSAAQQQDAVAKARVAGQRRRILFEDPESDEHLLLLSQVEEADPDELAETLVSFKLEELRTQAREEVLHSPDIGSDWGPDGSKYMDNVEAISQRVQELGEDVDYLEDDEIKRLNKISDKFWSEVTDRFNDLKTIETNRIKMGKTTEQMRKELVTKLVELEYSITWMREYQLYMLYMALRDPDNRKRPYFSSIEEMLEVPDYVMDQLFAAYEDVNAAGDDIKNLPSPPLS